MKELSRRRFAFPAFAPRSVSWWVYVAAIAVGAASMIDALRGAAGRFPAAGVTAAFLIVPIAVTWWWLLRMPQLWMRMRRSGAAASVLWGATAATGIYALPSNGALITMLGQHVSIDTAQSWGAALAAPLTEETGKALAIALVVLVTGQRLRTPMDAALLAGFAGLGFTLTEDVLYAFNIAYQSFGEHEVISTAIVFFVRAVLFGAVSHVVFSAFVGAGVGFLVTGRGGRRVPLGLLGLVMGPALHFVWNSPFLVSLWARGAYVVVVPFLVWAAIRVVRSEEHRWFLRTLEAPGALGLVPPAYLGVVRATWWKRRAYRREVARAYGAQAAVAQRRLEADLTDLADAVASGDDQDAARLRYALENRLVRPQGAPN